MIVTAETIRLAAEGIDSAITAEFRSYSGRGMNGKECAAINLESAHDLIALGMSLACVIAAQVDADVDPVDAIDEAIGFGPNACVDSMGLGVVVYWPTVPVAVAVTR